MFSARDLTIEVKGKTIFPVWKVDLDLARQERVVVVGESGGGKTSLAWGLVGRCLPGQRVVAGKVHFQGADLLALSPMERSRFYYRDLALVPQNAQNIFHPTQRLWKSAREVIPKNEPSLMFKEVVESVAPLSESMDLPISLWSHYPHELSGGQKQRMAFILALVNSPKMLLLD